MSTDEQHLPSECREVPGPVLFPGLAIPAIVVERMLTDLHDLLLTTQLSLWPKCCLLHHVAKGLEYLHQHSPPIIHCNLSARSILLNSRLVAKIADLDVACVMPDVTPTASMTKEHERSVYMPPEAFNRNASIDIFSFGVISIFTLSQIIPYKTLLSVYYDMESCSLKSRTELEQRSDSMERVKTQLSTCGSASVDHPLIKMIHKCMRDAPTERPHIHEVLHLIQLAKTCIMDEEIIRKEAETLQVQFNRKMEMSILYMNVFLYRFWSILIRAQCQRMLITKLGRGKAK